MPRITATVSETHYKHLEQRAEELDRSMSEVARLLIQEDIDSDVLHSDAPHSEVSNSEVKRLKERVTDLEQRLTQLEKPAGPESSTESTQPDLLEYVRQNQPVSRKDIVEEFSDQIEAKHIKPDSWWRRHARPELDDSGAEHTRNVGWLID